MQLTAYIILSAPKLIRNTVLLQAPFSVREQYIYIFSADWKSRLLNNQENALINPVYESVSGRNSNTAAIEQP